MSEKKALFALFKMAELGVLRKFENNYDSDGEYCGVIASFTWGKTPEGHEFWSDISRLVD